MHFRSFSNVCNANSYMKFKLWVGAITGFHQYSSGSFDLKAHVRVQGNLFHNKNRTFKGSVELF